MKKLGMDESVLGMAASITGRACELIGDGWVKGAMHKTGDGGVISYCIHGALDAAMAEAQLVNPDVMGVAVAFVVDEAANLHGFKGQHFGAGIPAASFNDAGETKHEQVLSALDGASQRLWNLAMECEINEQETWTPSKWANTDVESETAKAFLFNQIESNN